MYLPCHAFVELCGCQQYNEVLCRITKLGVCILFVYVSKGYRPLSPAMVYNFGNVFRSVWSESYYFLVYFFITTGLLLLVYIVLLYNSMLDGISIMHLICTHVQLKNEMVSIKCKWKRHKWWRLLYREYVNSIPRRRIGSVIPL